MEFIIGLVLYMAGGIACMPMFAKEDFIRRHARWSMIQSEATSKAEAVGVALGKSLIWPIFGIMSYVLWRLNADDRAKAKVKAELDAKIEEQKMLAAAKRTIELHAAKDKFMASAFEEKWQKEFEALQK